MIYAARISNPYLVYPSSDLGLGHNQIIKHRILSKPNNIFCSENQTSNACLWIVSDDGKIKKLRYSKDRSTYPSWSDLWQEYWFSQALP
jgi:ABC-type uncharacterized transport system permease subunit